MPMLMVVLNLSIVDEYKDVDAVNFTDNDVLVWQCSDQSTFEGGLMCCDIAYIL